MKNEEVFENSFFSSSLCISMCLLNISQRLRDKEQAKRMRDFLVTKQTTK